MMNIHKYIEINDWTKPSPVTLADFENIRYGKTIYSKLSLGTIYFYEYKEFEKDMNVSSGNLELTQILKKDKSKIKLITPEDYSLWTRITTLSKRYLGEDFKKFNGLRIILIKGGLRLKELFTNDVIKRTVVIFSYFAKHYPNLINSLGNNVVFNTGYISKLSKIPEQLIISPIAWFFCFYQMSDEMRSKIFVLGEYDLFWGELESFYFNYLHKDKSDSLANVMDEIKKSEEKFDNLEKLIKSFLNNKKEKDVGVSGSEKRQPIDPQKNESSKSENIFRLKGDIWEISFEGITNHYKNLLGLQDLQILLNNPTKSIHVSVLYRNKSLNNLQNAEHLNKLSFEEINEKGLSITTSEKGIDAIDDKARADYYKRINRLKEEMEDAEEFGNIEKIEELREEKVGIKKQLDISLRKNKWTIRKEKDPKDRMRKAISARIKDVLKKFKNNNNPLFLFLDDTLEFGSYIKYNPQKSPKTVDWILE